MGEWGPDTRAVRGGTERSDFGEHSEALSLTASFVFASAAQAAQRFANEAPGNIYSRFTNPTVRMFQARLAALEGAEACIATATGMAAVATTAMALLKAGDHAIVARGVFGTIVPLFNQILARFGIETTWVSPTDVDAWRAAVRPNTRLLFVESPTNPVLEVADIATLAQIAREAGALLAVDNCVCSPALQQPIALGADLVVHSATKFIDGQGRTLGGAVAGRRSLIEGSLATFVRTAGPALSPFNAWIGLKGLETLRCAWRPSRQRRSRSRAGSRRIRPSSECITRASSRIRSSPSRRASSGWAEPWCLSWFAAGAQQRGASSMARSCSPSPPTLVTRRAPFATRPRRLTAA